jgi:hypothetical protein
LNWQCKLTIVVGKNGRFNGREDCLLAIAPLPEQDNLGLGADLHIEVVQLQEDNLLVH